MKVRLTFDDGAGGEPAEAGDHVDHAASLYRWLASDAELRGRAEVSIGADPSSQEHMGGVPELVDVVLTHAVALGGLVVAVATWRGSRPRPPQVRIERDGVTVTVHDGSAETVERVLRALGADPPGADPPGGEPGPGGGSGE
ncbi:hypothetical protein ABT390_04140 [Streptomyces aurantiacus]|uniref:Uncharacterized protein n=1 Tax=Streptomyces aurantiacus JA 4570 TaxID=1286094 RepID=S4AUB6_9ACTN|nr:hypothetical protein [Streptomyces aurantiacus]EPH45012.1 hypothetical protein STRAU_1913 [Streptomyces aurantiacus JA 4570]